MQIPRQGSINVGLFPFLEDSKCNLQWVSRPIFKKKKKNDGLEEKPLHPGVTSKETFTAGNHSDGAIAKRSSYLQPKPPNLLFSSIPSPRRTHCQFLSLCLKFYHNLLNSFSTFNLHTDHPPLRPPPQIQSFHGNQSDLFKMQI